QLTHGTLDSLETILLHRDLPIDRAEAVWQKALESEREDVQPGFGFMFTRKIPFVLYSVLAQKFPERLGVLTQNLLRALVSDNEEMKISAVNGLYRWLR